MSWNDICEQEIKLSDKNKIMTDFSKYLFGLKIHNANNNFFYTLCADKNY